MSITNERYYYGISHAADDYILLSYLYINNIIYNTKIINGGKTLFIIFFLNV